MDVKNTYLEPCRFLDQGFVSIKIHKSYFLADDGHAGNLQNTNLSTHSPLKSGETNL